jgi:hypothetical protein
MAERYLLTTEYNCYRVPAILEAGVGWEVWPADKVDGPPHGLRVPDQFPRNCLIIVWRHPIALGDWCSRSRR